MLSVRSRLGAFNPASLRRTLATITSLPQTYIEKVVQKHAVDLAPGKKVRAGDYVMIKPEHVMTHVSRFASSMLSQCSGLSSRALLGQHWTCHFQVSFMRSIISGTVTDVALLSQVQVDRSYQNLQPSPDCLHARPRRAKPLCHEFEQVRANRGLCPVPRDRLLSCWPRHWASDYD